MMNSTTNSINNSSNKKTHLQENEEIIKSLLDKENTHNLSLFLDTIHESEQNLTSNTEYGIEHPFSFKPRNYTHWNPILHYVDNDKHYYWSSLEDCLQWFEMLYTNNDKYIARDWLASIGYLENFTAKKNNKDGGIWSYNQGAIIQEIQNKNWWIYKLKEALTKKQFYQQKINTLKFVIKTTQNKKTQEVKNIEKNTNKALMNTIE